MPFFCYIVECADGSYYTGWSVDPVRRERQHNSGRGARYTRLHRPVHLVYVEECPDRSGAMHREAKIKQLNHEQKSKLAGQYHRHEIVSMAALQEVHIISPGRANLLGEHVDYNDGWVLPIAIDRFMYITALPLEDEVIHLHAVDLDESVEFTLASLKTKQGVSGQTLPAWAQYPAGVAAVLHRHGLAVKGLSAEFHSDLPMGAGLSSSAALEVGFAVLWQVLGGWKLDRMTLARYCQEAEVTYVGLDCGLMDQFASANGVAGHALLLDTRTFGWRPVPLPPGVAVVIADSRVRHKLVESAYNTRHDECNEAVRILKTKYPEIRALRDVSLEQLQSLQSEMPENIYKRARHIVSECGRVQQAVRLLEAGDSRRFGALMFQTHASLRDDYEVSCPELDALVEIAFELPGCLGARLTGAGFGGCTVNLVREEQVDDFIAQLSRVYHERTGIAAAIFRCKASDGARPAS